MTSCINCSEEATVNFPLVTGSTLPFCDKHYNEFKEKLHTDVATALKLEWERLAQIDLQQMAGLDEGNISRQIRNIDARINRTYHIIKYNPMKIGDSFRTLIETDKLERFNDLVEDYFTLETLIKESRNPDMANMGLWLTYESVFIPKYTKGVNELLQKEVGNGKTWEDLENADLYLKKYLYKEIRTLGYELEAQVSLALVQTVERDELIRLTRSLSQQRGEWQG